MIARDRPEGFEALDGVQCIELTTYREDGSEASTPVWFVSDDLQNRLFVETGRDTGKVGRIARNPHVRVAPCTPRGVVTGPAIDGSARLVDEGELVRQLQREKYGRKGRLFIGFYKLAMRVSGRPTGDAVYVEVVPRAELVRVPEGRAA